MADTKTLWQTIYDTLIAVNSALGPNLQPVIEEAGLAEVDGWFHLVLATGIDPEPISVDRIRVRGVYASPNIIRTRLQGLVEHGYLTADGDAHTVTDKARQAVEKVYEGQSVLYSALDPIPAEDGEQLIALLSRAIEGVTALAEPPTPGFDDAHRRPVTEDLPLIERFYRSGALLNAFRDDTHITSWKPHGVDGHVWELFSFIWNQEEMSEQQASSRGYTPEEDNAAIHELLNRGWIEPADEAGKYRTTESGQTLRDDVEASTDRYFYAAFADISDDEKVEIRDLVTRLNDGLQEIAAEAG